MTVTVVSMGGTDTAQAVIHSKHMRDDTIGFCRDYVQKVTPACVQEELAFRHNDEIAANCPRGDFAEFQGNRYRKMGPSRDKDSMTKYVLNSLASGEIADGSSTSGYPTNMQIFKALCPGRAPLEE